MFLLCKSRLSKDDAMEIPLYISSFSSSRTNIIVALFVSHYGLIHDESPFIESKAETSCLDNNLNCAAVHGIVAFL